MKPTRLPEGAWQEIAADMLGPLPTGECLLVVVDYFLRWMEVDDMRSTTSAAIIKCLDSHFARYGVLVGLRTDNGPNFVTEEKENTWKKWASFIIAIRRYGQEPVVRSSGRTVFQAEGKDWRSQLNKFLLAYRSTNTTTGFSPAELFFKRKLTTKLPELTDLEEKKNDVVLQQVRDRDAERKQQAKLC